MDRENRISTKPADRGMIKELCRYLDHFWRPEGEAPEAPLSEAPHMLEIPCKLESCEEERRRYTPGGKPLKKDRPIPAVGAVLSPFLSSLKSRLNKAEETCSERLLRLIRERGRDEVEVYQKAGVDRKLFSKMRRKNYRPKAKTLYAFIIVLQLTLDDAVDLLASAGYAFSSASRLDLAVTYFVEKGVGDLDEVNSVLYELGMETLP